LVDELNIIFRLIQKEVVSNGIYYGKNRKAERKDSIYPLPASGRYV
jgi:hypothetical protein